MKGVLLAIQFLTLIPLRIEGSVSADDVGRSSAFFPVVGLLKGALLALAYTALEPFLSPGITAALILIFSVLINGGFHIDGLADTFDAIASGKGREAKLRIMKDSSTGPIGVTAIVLVLGLKYLLLLELFADDPLPCLLLFPMIGSWTMVAAMFHGESAKRDGLGFTLISGTGHKQVLLATATALAVLTLTGLLLPRASLPEAVWFSVALLAAMYLLAVILVKSFTRHFNGLTGDNLGAISELSETAFLLVMAGIRGG